MRLRQEDAPRGGTVDWNSLPTLLFHTRLFPRSLLNGLFHYLWKQEIACNSSILKDQPIPGAIINGPNEERMIRRRAGNARGRLFCFI